MTNTPPRRTEEEIAQLVRDLIEGRIFTWHQISDPDLFTMVFMPVGMGGSFGYDPESIGCVYEEMSKALPRTINGLPMFLSCQFVHKEDWKTVAQRYGKAQAAIEKSVSP